MKYKGINYDTGTKTITSGTTRPTFDIDIVEKEIDIIKNELHCNAIRITGYNIDRVEQASEIALKKGLTVWFSPSLLYDNPQNTLIYILVAAKAAENLRKYSPQIVFVIAGELTLFTGGFVKGNTGDERLKNLFGPWGLLKNIVGIKRSYNWRLNKFLSEVVEKTREQFHGQITYASGTWEKPEWKIFDIIGVDLYRSSFNKLTYVKELQNYKKYGKPLSIMEFGCCTYKGAEDKGAMGWAIVDWKKNPPELKGNYERDEEVQSKYLVELLTILETEKVFAAFVFTFITCNYTYNDNPRYDLDLASYGVVKPMPAELKKYYQNLPWMPKRAFFDIGSFYAAH